MLPSLGAMAMEGKGFHMAPALWHRIQEKGLVGVMHESGMGKRGNAGLDLFSTGDFKVSLTTMS